MFAAQRGAHVSLGALRVVLEAHFQRDQAIVAQIYALRNRACLPIPEINVAAVLPCSDIVQIEAGLVGRGRA
jgi:hypothetical protein